MRGVLTMATFALALAACDDGVKCKFSSKPGQVSWYQCADDVSRAVRCDTVSCRCVEDEVVGNAFPPGGLQWSDRGASARMANDKCGWKLSQD